MSRAAARPVALVTGAGRRIGRAIALDLARAGFAVGVHYGRSGAEAAAVVAEITAGGGSALALPADLASASSASLLVPACATSLGPPVCLVNNASIFVDDSAMTLDAARWDEHMNVNLRAPVILARAFAEGVPSSAAANIINILDQRVWRPVPTFFSYSISKSALWAATRMLAQAFAPRIRVNGIGPGPVLKNEHQNAEDFDRQAAATLLGRPTAPEEIAAAVRFILASPAMTGQMIALDGGQHLAWLTPDMEAEVSRPPGGGA